MFVPNPKNAFQSPGVQSFGLYSVVIVVSPIPSADLTRRSSPLHVLQGGQNVREEETQPKMPPCAAIIASPASWNCGKYEAQQSPSTMQR